MTRGRSLAFALGLMLSMMGCARSDDSSDSSLRSEGQDQAETSNPPASPVPSTTTVVPSTIAPSDVAESLFVTLVQQSCTLGPVPDPGTASAEVLEADQFLITDGEGAQMILDAGARVVTAVEGRQAQLPYAYSFGCDPQVFLGTAD